MQQLAANDKKGIFIGVGLLVLFFVACVWSLLFVTSEAHQGEIYRIIYLHVPSAFSAFFSSFILFIISIIGLRKPQGSALVFGKATAEVGLLFTAITLAPGSIWGKPTWGVWWTWDARLTTTFILSLLYCGYLLLWSSMATGALRTKVCSVLGILIFADVPIIYKSVTWWRTLHQPPNLMRGGGPTMASEILIHLLICIALTVALTGWLIWQRGVNLQLKEKIDQASYAKMDQ